MEVPNITPLLESGTLGVLAVVSIWGTIRGVKALWGALEKRGEELKTMQLDFVQRLEERQVVFIKAMRQSTEESVRVREHLGQLLEENQAIRESLSSIAALLQSRADIAFHERPFDDDAA